MCEHGHAVSIEVTGALVCRWCSDCHTTWWEDAGTRVPLQEALVILRRAMHELEKPRTIAGLVPDKELLTATEVAKAFAVTPRTIANWVAAGSLQAAFITPGGRYRFRRADVLALTSRQAAGAERPEPPGPGPQ